MTYKEATQRIREQFNNLNRCPLCNKEILRCETFEYIAYHEGRYKRFVLFHSACLAESHKKVLIEKSEERYGKTGEK